MGDNLEVRAKQGHRAAVLELRPGLYLVSEVKAEQVDFGMVPFLMPVLSQAMVRAARKALQNGALRKKDKQKSTHQVVNVPVPVNLAPWIHHDDPEDE